MIWLYIYLWIIVICIIFWILFKVFKLNYDEDYAKNITDILKHLRYKDKPIYDYLKRIEFNDTNLMEIQRIFDEKWERFEFTLNLEEWINFRQWFYKYVLMHEIGHMISTLKRKEWTNLNANNEIIFKIVYFVLAILFIVSIIIYSCCFDKFTTDVFYTYMNVLAYVQLILWVIVWFIMVLDEIYANIEWAKLEYRYYWTYNVRKYNIFWIMSYFVFMNMPIILFIIYKYLLFKIWM